MMESRRRRKAVNCLRLNGWNPPTFFPYDVYMNINLKHDSARIPIAVTPLAGAASAVSLYS